MLHPGKQWLLLLNQRPRRWWETGTSVTILSQSLAQEWGKEEISKININGSLGIRRSRINKRSVREWLYSFNIYKSAEPGENRLNISTTQLLRDTLPLLFAAETYVPGTSKQADLALEIKQPQADPRRGGLVNVSKPPVKIMNEIINQSANTLRKITW